MKKKKTDFIIYTILLILVGSGLIGISLVMTPDFAITYISNDGILSPQGLKGFQIFRISSFSLGCLLLLTAILFVRFRTKVTTYIESIDFPILTILFVLIGWGALAIFNLVLIIMDFKPGTASYFPISIFKLRLSLSGLPYSFLFLVLFILALKPGTRFLKGTVFLVWLIGLLLIILGNLAQGSVDAAFRQSLLWGDNQYYHDAIKVSDWLMWLKDFNVKQSGGFLISHTRTHPPFAILIHYFLLKLWGNNLLALGVSLTILSSLSIPLVWKIMRSLGLSTQHCSQFALLFSVLPAFNIYSAVSFDGVVLTTSTIFLLGLIKVLQEKATLSGTLLIITGLVLSNALTFGGVFLIMVLGIMAMRRVIIDADYRLFKVLLITLAIAIFTWGLMSHLLEYDHIRAFLTASHAENPDGFRLFSDPLNYIMTRIEGLAEIALFASIGVFTFMLRPKYLNLKPFDINDVSSRKLEARPPRFAVQKPRRSQPPRNIETILNDDINSVFFASLIALLLMFLAGTYRTGETARACLFIYPYFLLLLRKIDRSKMRWITLGAGLQTLVMQTLGWYLW